MMGAITGTMLAVGAGLALAGAGAGIGISALSSSGKKQDSGGFQMPQAPAPPSFDASSEKARLAAEDRRRAMARSKSVNTNPLGIAEDATVAKTKLLGG